MVRSRYLDGLTPSSPGLKDRTMRRSNSIKIGIAAIAVAALSIFGAATASAHTDIWVGGNTDCTSQGYMHAGANPNPNDVNIPVSYGTCDGAFAPFLGSTRASDAIQQGVDAARQVWNDNCPPWVQCTLHGFSIGAAPVTIVGNDVGADKPGSNTHVITEGNAWGQPGVFGGKPGIVGVGVNIGAPFASVPTHIDQVPNSENRFNVNDGWADDATQQPQAEITDLSCLNGCGGLPPQHYIQTGQPTAKFDTNDGVHQLVYGDPLPGVVPPQDNPLVNPQLTAATSPVAPVLADPADAFGQQMAGLPPCVAPDGGTFYTPAGVGC